jgi:lipopolysaccharide biosynthesis glycosyltransferase
LQHENPERAQIEGPPTSAGVGKVNSGTLVIVPSEGTYALIAARMADAAATSRYTFPDQDLISDLFGDRWVSLPYVYNALKTLRWKEVHAPIWRDDRVKNMHYISIPKPWAEENITDVTYEWWWKMNKERLDMEAQFRP